MKIKDLDKKLVKEMTSAGSVAAVVNPGAKRKSQKKNKNGTAKNALDTGDNLMGGGTVKR